MTLLRSISSFVPRPPHEGQAPRGELNEKLRGSISRSKLCPFGQDAFSLKNSSSPPSSLRNLATALPPESSSAVSTESVRRLHSRELRGI